MAASDRAVTELRAGARQVPAPLKDTALAAQVALSALCALSVAILWAGTGMGYFWPMWVWFGLALALALHAGIRWTWAEPVGRRRQLAVHATASAILGTSAVIVWALAGGGSFWPVSHCSGWGWPLLCTPLSARLSSATSRCA